MNNDFMDIGGFVPLFEGRYFLERRTGKVYKVDIDSGELREIDAPDDLSDLDIDDDKTT